MSEDSKARLSTEQRIAREWDRFVRKFRRPSAALLGHIAFHRMRLRHRLTEGTLKQGSRSGGKVVLYRILGNDLVPRHHHQQTLLNLKFILEHEPRLERCEKRWVLNRIFDPDSEAALRHILESTGQEYIHVPFELHAYRAIELDLGRFPAGFFESGEFENLNATSQARARASSLRLKNLYAMNNNGARNLALEEGRNLAEWILPWDGNCFMTPDAWSKVLASLDARSYFDYHVVPMARIIDNAELLNGNSKVNAVDEPQLIFHREAREAFHPDIPYGRRPKIELLSRLGVAGPWDRWRADPWDLETSVVSSDRFLFGRSNGWVARLASGQPGLERGRTAYADRAHARNIAIIQTIDMLDRMAATAQSSTA